MWWRGCLGCLGYLPLAGPHSLKWWGSSGGFSVLCSPSRSMSDILEGEHRTRKPLLPPLRRVHHLTSAAYLHCTWGASPMCTLPALGKLENRSTIALNLGQLVPCRPPSSRTAAQRQPSEWTLPGCALIGDSLPGNSNSSLSLHPGMNRQNTG